MLPRKEVSLPHFTVDERIDFLRILDLMRIDHTLHVKFTVSVSHEADHEAMLLILSEFNRGRIAKT